MLVSDFDFDLPEELIAQEPPTERSGARMLQLDRANGVVRDSWFREFPDLLREGDVLVLNDSRVIPARLLGQKAAAEGKTYSGKIEALLTQQLSEWEWTALVRPGRKVLVGDSLVFRSSSEASADGETLLQAEVVEHGEFGERLLRFHPVPDFFARLDKIGHMPLPPYIRRPDDSGDRQRYQTVYAQRPGSAAAPDGGAAFLLPKCWRGFVLAE